MGDPGSVQRLQDEHTKVVSDCRAKIQHWEKVRMDYSVLRDRLSTLPDRLHYSIMVPMGPLAFMPGHLIKTNEVTVLLGDNWFASLSAKQAEGIAEHRMQHVQKTIDDLGRAQGSIESRQRFTSELAGLDKERGNMEIREELTERDEQRKKGKPRVAHSPHSGSPAPPRETPAAPPGPRHQQEDAEELNRIWARLDELEREEEAMDEVYRAEDSNPADDDVVDGDIADDNAGGGGDILEDSESNQIHRHLSVTTKSSKEEWEEAALDGEGLGEDVTEWEGTPTIRFSHTTEPKKVRIDTGRNTTLKFSERREQQQQQHRRRRHSGGSNGGTTTLRSPADIYRWFVDVASGHRRPRKSILKSRSHEDGLGSDEFSYGSHGGSSSNSYSGSSNGSSSYNGSSNGSISDSIISAIIAGSGGGGGCAGDGVFHPSEEGDGDTAGDIIGNIVGMITGNNNVTSDVTSSSNNNNIDSTTANSAATNSTTNNNNNSTCESSITSRSPTTTDNSSEEVEEMSRCQLPDAFSGVVSERSARPSRGAPPSPGAPPPPSRGAPPPSPPPTATARHDDGRGGGAEAVGDGSHSGEPPAPPRRVSKFKAERLASMR
ncbi:unconventional prefoldin RPB5 interactor 1 isoform X1 [Petromyzon marinus]|uniref:unconventional prefoldin RPB5 interactor 1 isoform X1 n=2 Tax=Petromyzon marinus TaxID=7757 RepID=UPI003F72C7D9